jgi:hypothetical protein
MITLPAIPKQQILKYVKTISYSDILTPQNTYQVLIFGIPQEFYVCGTMISLLQTFSGTSLTSLTCSIGAFVPNSTISSIDYFGSGYELTQAVTPTSFSLSGPPGNNLHNIGNYAPVCGRFYRGTYDIAAYFTSRGTTLNNLTVGSVEITVHITTTKSSG